MTIALAQSNSHLVIGLKSGGSILCYYTNRDDKKIHWFNNKTLGFPLAPFCNRIRNGKFTFANKQFALALNAPPHSLHGSAWQASWQLKKKTANSCTIYHQEIANKLSPFSYKIEQTFILAKSLLSIQLKLTNIGEETLPFGLGFHPYFSCDETTIVQAKTDNIWLTDKFLMPTKLVHNSMVKHLGDGLKPAQTNLDNSFTGWKRKAWIFWSEEARRMKISATSPLDYLCIYSPGDGSFCVEPVSNVPDAFNLMAKGQSNHGSLILKPRQTVKAQINFEIFID